ncbi:MAG: trypsin-like peptidase domain-containing protein [Chloroflexi bacterium]|nr:trypsin-like peptidase domain-containing protein [Chloroflexota bacterium]
MDDTTQQREPAYRPSDWYAPAPAEPVRPPAPAPRRRAPMGLIVLALIGGLLLGSVGGAVSGAAIARSMLTAATPVALVAAAPTAAPALAAAPPQPATATRVPAPAAPLPTAAPPQPVAATAAAGGVVADIAARVGPAVVSISSRSGGRGGIGSGFIIDGQGHILTNNHVVQGATSLLVTMADGSSYPATVVGTAPGNDLALIKIDLPAGELVIARLGDSDAVVAGELAVAIGSPSGLEQTVTSGIVSSTGRTYGGGGQRPLRGLIQTDAAINPGNSGGPLLNGNGDVIGINTLKAPDTQGIGFAVPINTAKRLLPQLRTGGRVSSPYLGISGRALNAQIAQATRTSVTEGVVVVSVVEGGPAATAGIQGSATTQGDAAGAGGDVITAIDGQPVRRVEDIGAILDSRKVGDTVAVTIVRGDQTRQVNVVLAEWPNS